MLKGLQDNLDTYALDCSRCKKEIEIIREKRFSGKIELLCPECKQASATT
jgi:phage FluMu protein Com